MIRPAAIFGRMGRGKKSGPSVGTPRPGTPLRAPAGRRDHDPRSFARAEAVVRRIVAERHDRPSLVSRIACGIGAEIIEQTRLPGDDLNSVELSRHYRTSRTPIREALMLLEKEGLVDVPPRRRRASPRWQLRRSGKSTTRAHRCSS